jgi:hypothetical protein
MSPGARGGCFCFCSHPAIPVRRTYIPDNQGFTGRVHNLAKPHSYLIHTFHTSLMPRPCQGCGRGAGKGPETLKKGRFGAISARFFAFFRRDFRKILLMIKELSALCAKRSAPFFDLVAETGPWTRITVEKCSRDTGPARMVSNCEDWAIRRPLVERSTVMIPSMR